MAVMAVWFSCAKKTGKDHRISREPVRPETDPFDEKSNPPAMLNIINLRKKWKGICSQVPFIVLKYRQGCI